MTTTEAAREWGVSRRTVSKWCRTGKLPEGWQAEKVRRRWVITETEPGGVMPDVRPEAGETADETTADVAMPGSPDASGAETVSAGKRADGPGKTDSKQEAPMAEWPWYVAKEYAIQDGREPEDFRFDQWPVSDAVLAVSPSRHLPIRYRCRIPEDTPQANVYEEVEPGTGDSGARLEYRKLPDPVGMALSRVDFKMFDDDTVETLHESSTDRHDDGAVEAGVSGSDRDFWSRHLLPGQTREVRVSARPIFYFLMEDGGAQLAYANMGLRGYFGGGEITSPVYALSMDEDGEITIRPKAG